MIKNHIVLGKKLREAISKISGKPYIDEADVKNLIKEIQKALIASDVNIRLVLQLSKNIERKALKEEMKTLSLKEHVLRIVYEELVSLMGKKYEPTLSKKRILLCGLFGSGKTTTAGKLAAFYKKKGFSVALIAADFDRPAAKEQLKQLANEAQAVFYNPSTLDEIETIISNIKEEIVIIDSAGRSGMDEILAEELKKIYKMTKPEEIFLVISADLGQIAEKQAKSFSETIPLTGVIVTKMDGSAKGGAALSAVAAAKVPVTFIGVGEKLHDLELYDPKRFVGRLLGMPDIHALIEKAKEAGLEEVEIEDELNAETLLKQLKAAKKMGPLSNVLSMLGAVDLPKSMLQEGEEKLKGFEAIIQSMTKLERKEVDLLKKQPSRIKRIARGSGRSEEEVKQFVSHFDKMSKMFRKFKKDRNMQKKLQGLMSRLGG